MSRNLLVVAFAALSLTCATGASANEHRAESTPIVHGSQPAPAALDFGIGEGRLEPGAPRADHAENHVAKAGVWSSIKGAAKKVGGAVVKAGKAVANSPVGRVGAKVAKGVAKVAVPVAKGVWNSPPVKGVRNAVKAFKVIVLKKKA